EAVEEREGAARRQLGHQREREPGKRRVVEGHRVCPGSHERRKRLLYLPCRCKSPRTFARSRGGGARARSRTGGGRRSVRREVFLAGDELAAAAERHAVALVVGSAASRELGRCRHRASTIV